MAVCDSNLKFLNLVAKWPGSSHEAFVWSNSVLCQIFENGNIARSWLVGDSAYPLKKYLLIFLLNPSNPQQEAYNEAQAKTRASIEKAFGVLKMRFRCTDRSGGILIFRPERAFRIVAACVVLHNICTKNNVPVPRNRYQYRFIQQPDNVVYQGVNNDGAEVRILIQTRF
ncbi:putative nuclease HARBI1 [Saccostrea echinata]|uniref:putative nuclease HARBI1 n=1 Tax=Saccostrea echinata TaxID=191078 RepID=UPI002A7FE589|nr:putative nuclease HARBI1 [Saccostrea echinata]